jgi:exopolysaccharide production protein ExoZ
VRHAGPANDKVVAIQLLRALAAATVAAGHIAFAFANDLGSGLGLLPEAAALGAVSGQIAVMLFFVVSGYVMVIAAKDMFAMPSARRLFWRRRFIRIMPPYWLASGLLAVIFLTLFPTPLDPGKIMRSLVLIPYWPGDGTLRPLPFLWVGWTLFYEMMFYFWFGLFLGLPRMWAFVAVAGVLAALVIAGTWVPPVNPLLFAATRPVSLIFAVGMAIALWRSGGAQAAAWLRWLALAASVAMLWLAPDPQDASALGWDYLAWCGAPALLIAFAALGGPLLLPVSRWINRAGDISYAVYLLHVPIAWFWLWFWGRLPFFDAGPWDYLISALLATLGLSLLFFTVVERPITMALNRWLTGPHSIKDPDRKTP